MMAAAPGDWISVRVSNPGGAVPSGLVYARIREKLYAGGIILPAQSGDVVISCGRIGEVPVKYWSGNLVSEIVAVWAEDLEGRMWECRNGVVPRTPMPDPGSDEFFAWLEEVRAQGRQQLGGSVRGLMVQHLLERLYRRLRRRHNGAAP
jgi:hypothetical protein